MKQTFIARLKDKSGNYVTFERFSCRKPETVKAQLLKVYHDSSLYRVCIKPAEIVEVYATPDGYNADPIPVIIFELKAE